jgi:hypothetical protein
MFSLELELLQRGSGGIYWGMRACKTKTTTNKSNTTKNDWGSIMGKFKQVAKCAPNCSAVQFCGQDKPWTVMAFVESP